METRIWLFVALLVAVCAPLVLPQENDEPEGAGDTGSVEERTENAEPEVAFRGGGGGGEETVSTEETEPTAESTESETAEEDETTEVIDAVTKKDFDIIGVRMESYLGRNFSAFCGIPYAEPPLGFRRFKQPTQIRYDGTIDATKCEDTPVCMQIRWQDGDTEPIGSEDCLFLNVYEPETETTNLPVIVYFHGGGFFSGSGTYKDAGPEYFMDQDVVFVTVNYRLGPLGFFSLNQRDAPGNLGLYDQVMALRWVQTYIKHFHGDKYRVTIMGEGAGGAMVHLHLFSPMSRGLFSRAISQSGVAFNSWALVKDMVNTSKTHAAILGCNREKEALTMKCMRELEAEEIVNSTAGLHYWLKEPQVIYRPMVQTGREGIDIFLRENPLNLLRPKKFNNVPWLVGVVNTPGFFHTKRYLQDNVMLTALLAKFEEYGSAMLEMHLSIPDSEERQHAMSSIKPIYESRNGAFNRDSLLQIFNDRQHNLGQMLAVTYHALSSHKDLYQYRFEYRGMHSMGENVTAIEGDAVVNGDDLIYLLRRPSLFPDFDRSDQEGKRDFQMMKKLTTIWAQFAATGHVKALHRSKRENAVLIQRPTDTPETGLFAKFISKLSPRQRRTVIGPAAPEISIDVANEIHITVDSGDASNLPGYVDEVHIPADSGDAPNLPGGQPRDWRSWLAKSYKNKSKCWDNYPGTVWPAVMRFRLTAGNVPSLPYMSFRKGDDDSPVEFCLKYLMEFDRLIHWTQLPLREVLLPDIFLTFTSTTSTTQVTTVSETTHLPCPTMPITMPPEEPQTVLPPHPGPPPMPTIMPPGILPTEAEPELPPPPMPTSTPTTPEPPEPPMPETEEPEVETASQPQSTYTWPQYPKPPEPTRPSYPPFEVPIPIPTLTIPPGLWEPNVTSYRPTPPRQSFSRETFTWPVSSSERPASPGKPQPPQTKPPKPSREKPKGKAPPCVVCSYTSLLLLLLLVVQF